MKILSLLILSLMPLWWGCEPAAEPSVPAESGSQRSDARPFPAESRNSREAKKVDFLNRVRETDPQYKTIERALLNEKNELGLVLGRNVEMDAIPKLMRGMLIEMAKEFPGEDLTIVAYTPSEPPIKLGTAHLDAQTKDMTYTPTKTIK